MGMHIPMLVESNSSYSRYRGVERRRAHQEACFRYMENALTGVCITQDARILTCNERFIEMFGFSREELSGLKLSELIHADSQPETQDRLDVAAHAAEVRSIQEAAGLTKGGKMIAIQQTVSGLQYDGSLTAVHHVIDVTDQKAIVDALRVSERELRLLSEQVLQTQESERKRVASELHDGIGQVLSSIKIVLENTFCELGDNLPSEALLRLAGTVSKVRAAIEEVRRISMDLRPAMLDDLGIEPTINWFCREFQLSHPSIKIFKKLELLEVDVGGTLGAVIFRILQEALNNIAKHANATRIHVSLKARRGAITLSVKDNGRGFIADVPGVTGGGFGLYSMRERTSLSGGRLSIYSVVGSGTRVSVTWARDDSVRQIRVRAAARH